MSKLLRPGARDAAGGGIPVPAVVGLFDLADETTTAAPLRLFGHGATSRHHRPAP